MNKKNIIFLGTPLIAKKALEVLNSLENINILCVISQPDKAKDRKNNFIFQDVKKYCIENNITLYQPEKIGLIKDELIKLKPDALITCAYGQFIPESILNIPLYGAYNLHASLLPALRGGAPIHHAIINQYNETGWTLMKMVKKMDAGDYCAQYKIKIEPNYTTIDLYNKLCDALETFIPNNINKIFDPNTKWITQDDNKVTFGYNIKKEETIINFNANANTIDAFIRGLYDKPIALWFFKNKYIKVYKAKISNEKSTLSPGNISKITKDGIYISTLDYDIILTTIQFPNKNIINISDVFHNIEWLNKMLNEEI